MATLNEWIEQNPIDDALAYKSAARHQFGFAHELHRLVVPDLEMRRENDLNVIGSHTSKSVRLPVYMISTQDVALVFRDNFHNLTMSVMANRRVPDLFHGLFNRTHDVHTVHFEGVADHFVFGSYETDQEKFTIVLNSDYAAWTFVYLLAIGLGIRR